MPRSFLVRSKQSTPTQAENEIKIKQEKNSEIGKGINVFEILVQHKWFSLKFVMDPSVSLLYFRTIVFLFRKGISKGIDLFWG